MANEAAGAIADADNATPTKECDVIMKGGITSGVVFPLAIAELSKQYRFVNLGGTSAGAIAAAVAAAAEYNRDKGGFERIKEIPNELGDNLLKLFQPSPKLKPLFDILIALSKKPQPGEQPVPKFSLATLRAIAPSVLAFIGDFRKYPLKYPLIGLLAGFAIFLLAVLTLHTGWAAFGVLLVLVSLISGFVIVIGSRLIETVVHDLPDNNYGFCTGATQDRAGYGHTAVTEWLADTIDECAGLKASDQPGGDPLTFGHLKAPPSGKPISLEMMTTNLSMKRPYRLPFRDRVYLYREADIRALLPQRVAEFMIKNSKVFTGGKEEDAKTDDTTGQIKDFRYLPAEEHFPVIFAVRLSLSFPLLFTAVPLYARDFTLMGDQDDKPRLCLFSDGGIANNFPIQFFDHLWPNAPTFGIGLDEYNKERDRNNSRIFLPKVTSNGRASTSGALLPIDKIEGLPAFLTSIVFTAKDWQDNLQSTQHGYRERIVHVALTPDEGGLNLTMPEATVTQLTEYGRQAGETLVREFNLDEHRWRRFLVAMARLETTLFELKKSYETALPDTQSFKDFLQRYPQQSPIYKPASPEWLAKALGRAQALVAMANEWQSDPLISDGRIPKPPSDLRITPKP